MYECPTAAHPTQHQQWTVTHAMTKSQLWQHKISFVAVNFYPSLCNNVLFIFKCSHELREAVKLAVL